MTKQLLFIASICLLSGACYERDVDNVYVCENNCTEVNIKGRIFNKSFNTGVPNIDITSRWEYRTGGLKDFVYYRQHLGSAKTDASGNFTLKVMVDTNRFKNADVYLTMPTNRNRFFYPNRYPNSGAYYEGTGDYEIQIQSDTLKFVDINLYEKVKFKVNVSYHPDSFPPSVSKINIRSLDFVNKTYTKYFDTNGIGKDTTMIETVAANENVIVKWYTVRRFGIVKESIDTVKIDMNIENILNLRY